MIGEEIRIIKTYDVTKFREQWSGVHDIMLYLPDLIEFLKECDISAEKLNYKILFNSKKFFYEMPGQEYITQLSPYRFDLNDICFTKIYSYDMRIYYSPDDV
jgi:hypothetical protein